MAAAQLELQALLMGQNVRTAEVLARKGIITREEYYYVLTGKKLEEIVFRNKSKIKIIKGSTLRGTDNIFDRTFRGE